MNCRRCEILFENYLTINFSETGHNFNYITSVAKLYKRMLHAASSLWTKEDNTYYEHELNGENVDEKNKRTNKIAVENEINVRMWI